MMDRRARLYRGDATTPPIITLSGVLDDPIVPADVRVLSRTNKKLGTLEGWLVSSHHGGSAVLIGPGASWDATGDPPDRFALYKSGGGFLLDAESTADEVAEQIGTTGNQLAAEIHSIGDAVSGYPVKDAVVDPLAGQITSAGDQIAQGIRDAIGAVTAYPVPTTDGQTATLRTDTGDADSRVASAVAALLGTSPNPLDLLNEVDRKLQAQPGPNGRTDYVWTQAAYAGTNAVGAGITGDQATALQFATDAADGLSALADIEPLLPEVSDPEDVRAQLALLTSTWTAFVTTLGTEGGPDPVRAPAYREQSLTAIKALGRLYSMLDTKNKPTTAYVFTPEQERQRTIFLTALRRVQAACEAFDRYLGTEQTDIGRELVLLQESLDVISVLSQSVASAMDAVRVVDADRQLMSINPADPNAQTIGELLDWASAFARDEAMPQLESSGLRAIPVIAASLRHMSISMSTLAGALGPQLPGSNGASGDPYAPLRQDRVRIPLRDLQAAVKRALTQATGSSIPDAYPPPLFVAVKDYITNS